MDWLQFFASVTGSLAWPVAAIFLGFMFRMQVRKLLDKMKSLKAPGIEASFTERVEEVAVEARKVEQAKTPALEDNSPKQKPTPPPEIPQVKEWRRRHREAVTRVMDERPAALVLNAWNDVETRIKDLVVASDTGCGVHSPEDAITKLADKPWNVIDKATGDVLLNLLALRNQVAHVEFEPDRTAAVNYVKSADRMAKQLDVLLAEHDEHFKIGSSIESP
jgi:hypothetical protein